MRSVECLVRARIPTEFGGSCHILLYTSTPNHPENEQNHHFALVYDPKDSKIHSNFHSYTLNEIKSNDTFLNRSIRGCSLDVDGNELFHINELDSNEKQQMINGNLESSLIDSNINKDDLFKNNIKKHSILTRIHSCCFTGETIGSLRCDCAEQLHKAMHDLSQSDEGGIILYLKQEGRGIGILEKLKAYNLIDMGLDTMQANVALGHPADGRTYDIASSILNDLNVSSIKLLTNNPDKIAQIRNYGIDVVERIPMIPESWQQLLESSLITPTDSSVAEGNDMAPNLFHSSSQAISLDISDTNTDIESSLKNNIFDIPNTLLTTITTSSPPSIMSSDSSVISEATNSTAASPTVVSNNTNDNKHYIVQDRDTYLITKIQRMGHILNIPSELVSGLIKT